MSDERRLAICEDENLQISLISSLFCDRQREQKRKSVKCHHHLELNFLNYVSYTLHREPSTRLLYNFSSLHFFSRLSLLFHNFLSSNHHLPCLIQLIFLRNEQQFFPSHFSEASTSFFLNLIMNSCKLFSNYTSILLYLRIVRFPFFLLLQITFGNCWKFIVRLVWKWKWKFLSPLFFLLCLRLLTISSGWWKNRYTEVKLSKVETSNFLRFLFCRYHTTHKKITLAFDRFLFFLECEETLRTFRINSDHNANQFQRSESSLSLTNDSSHNQFA